MLAIGGMMRSKDCVVEDLDRLGVLTGTSLAALFEEYFFESVEEDVWEHYVEALREEPPRELSKRVIREVGLRVKLSGKAERDLLTSVEDLLREVLADVLPVPSVAGPLLRRLGTGYDLAEEAHEEITRAREELESELRQIVVKGGSDGA